MPIKDQQPYETLLPKIAEYLDGNTEVILSHSTLQDWPYENLFDVSFAPKKSGIQTGFTCDVSNGTQCSLLYQDSSIRTH
jgi:hypothetical protein